MTEYFKIDLGDTESPSNCETTSQGTHIVETLPDLYCAAHGLEIRSVNLLKTVIGRHSIPHSGSSQP